MLVVKALVMVMVLVMVVVDPGLEELVDAERSVVMTTELALVLTDLELLELVVVVVDPGLE